MDVVAEYIKPELFMLVFALYFVGNALKSSKDIKDKNIPLLLGALGIFFCMLWVVATSRFTDVQSVLLGIFTGVVQGVLVAGCSVYANQVIKQAAKTE